MGSVHFVKVRQLRTGWAHHHRDYIISTGGLALSLSLPKTQELVRSLIIIIISLDRFPFLLGILRARQYC